MGGSKGLHNNGFKILNDYVDIETLTSLSRQRTIIWSGQLIRDAGVFLPGLSWIRMATVSYGGDRSVLKTPQPTGSSVLLSQRK